MAILKIRDDNGNVIDIAAIKGDNGNTPQKGVDYWAEADKAEIQAYINQQLCGSTEKQC